ncbi:MAG TPA: IPT/TIG domain-containing protein [Dermatophilaceae bacterium]|nr:IPT/TIG domain-containing protein [Dermatophilaceae bacterium]
MTVSLDRSYTIALTARNASGPSAAVSKTITVTAIPTPSAAHISGLSTDEARVGTWVTITGSRFGTPGTVNFGTVAATVSYWSSTRIVVRVPALVSGHEVDVIVTPLGGTASNGVEFEVKSDRRGDDGHGGDDH